MVLFFYSYSYISKDMITNDCVVVQDYASYCSDEDEDIFILYWRKH